MYLFIAFLTGVYGYLLPGVINFTLVELSYQKRRRMMLGLLLLALVFEWLYCFGALYLFDHIRLSGEVLRWLQAAGCLLALVIGIVLLVSASREPKQRDRLSIASCISIIIIHPQQIPFWIFIRLLLAPVVTIPSLFWFASLNTLGAFAVFLTYLVAGRLLYQKINPHRQTIRRGIGVLYIIMAMWGLWHL